MADVQTLPAAPQVADPSRAGISGARKVIKHTILSNPKETAWLIAILVFIIVVLGYMLWKAKKGTKDSLTALNSSMSSGTSNYQTGSNNGLSFLGSYAAGGHLDDGSSEAAVQGAQNLMQSAQNLSAAGVVDMSGDQGLVSLGSGSCGAASSMASEDMQLQVALGNIAA